MAAGRESSFFICDGSLWVVGSNSKGTLGVGEDHASCCQPIQLDMESNIVSVSASKDFCLLLDENGRAYQVGNNMYEPKTMYTPEIIENIPKIKAIEASGYGYFLIDCDNNVWSSGYNAHSTLGKLLSYTFQTWEKLPNLANIQQISAGEFHTLFLDTNGIVWGCGDLRKGRLGQGRPAEQMGYTLPKIIPGIPPVVMVSACNDHSMFLDVDGRVWLCGQNFSDASNPRLKVEMVEELVDIVLIHAALVSCFAVDKAGVVYQLGTFGNVKNSTWKPFLPVKDVIEIASSRTHILFVDFNGSVWSFGENTSGQLALGHCYHVDEPQLCSVIIGRKTKTKSARNV